VQPHCFARAQGLGRQESIGAWQPPVALELGGLVAIR